jgi:uncharacterized protein DUF4238
LFGDVDHRAARVLHKILASGLKSIALEDRLDWVTFIMSLRLRQPDIIHDLKQDSESELKKSLAAQPEQYEELTTNGDPPSLEEWTEQHFPGLIENVGLSFLADFVGDQVVRRKIFEMNGSFGTFPELTSCYFLTIPAFSQSILMILTSSLRCRFRRHGFSWRRGAKGLPRYLGNKIGNSFAMRLNESSVRNARVRVYARNSSPRRFILNRMQAEQNPTTPNQGAIQSRENQPERRALSKLSYPTLAKDVNFRDSFYTYLKKTCDECLSVDDRDKQMVNLRKEIVLRADGKFLAEAYLSESDTDRQILSDRMELFTDRFDQRPPIWPWRA